MMREVDGFFYTFRGNGYGPFLEKDGAVRAAIERRERASILAVGRSGAAFVYKGKMWINRNKQIVKTEGLRCVGIIG